MIVVPVLRNTSSKLATNWPPPSRIKNRIVRSWRIVKLRAAWVVQGPVGFLVIPARCEAAAVKFDEEQHVVAT
jgi:hypothetical protein